MEHHVNMSTIGQNSVEVVLGNNKKAKSAKNSDPRAKFERMLNALRKKISISALKTHLLCWLAHGFYLNRICLEDQHLAAQVLSYSVEIKSSGKLNPATIDLDTLKTYLKNANKVLIADKDHVKRLLESTNGTETITAESMRDVVGELKFTTYLQYVLIVVLLLRLNGLRTRLCVCFDVIDAKSFSEKINSRQQSIKVNTEKSSVDKNNNQANNDDQDEEMSDESGKSKSK